MRGVTGAIGLVLSGALSMAAVVPSIAQEAKPLVVGVEADVSNPDPARAMGLSTWRMLFGIYDSLLSVSGTKIEPGLATSWNISPDGLQYTLKLRDGVRFHDGTQFNAEAVKFSFERMIDPHNPFYDASYPWVQTYFGALDHVEIVDEMTVRFVLKRRDATFLISLANVTGAIVSPTALRSLGASGFQAHPVGTGPFKFVRWDKGERLVLEANKDYWRGVPKVETLIFKPIPDPVARLNELRAGEVNVIIEFPPEFIPQIKNDPNLRITQQVGNHTWWIALNTRQPPFDNLLVRQAVNYAVDREALIEGTLYGAAVPSTGFSPKGDVWTSPDVNRMTYDPQKAKKLLAEANYPNGFTTTLLVPESGSGMIAPVAIATVVQAYLAKVGITVKIVSQEWNSYMSTYTAGLEKAGAGMGAMSWMRDTGDPALYVPANIACDHVIGFFNTGGYCNPRLDKIFAAAAAATSEEERVALYHEVDKIAVDDAPWLFLFHANQVIASTANVSGVMASPTFLIRWEDLSIH